MHEQQFHSFLVSQRHQNRSQRQQQGFVGIVFLAIALIGIVIGAIAAMSRSSSSGVGQQSALTNAAVLMKQMSDYKLGVDRMLISGVARTAITFDGTVGTGLFDPSPGARYSVEHIAPASAISGGPMPGFSNYSYHPAVLFPNALGPGTVSAAVAAGPLTLEVCQQLNHLISNDPVSAQPSASSNPGIIWGAASPPGMTFFESAYPGRTEACIKSTDGYFIYYKTVIE